MDFRIALFLIALTFSTTFSADAQKAQPVIRLTNPSFEGTVINSGKLPTGWEDSGITKGKSESPPDTQPGYFEVTKLAQNGKTYLGMVVRDNDTREAVSQRLSSPMIADYCYSFSMWLCRSEIYKSMSQSTNEPANYSTPAKIRIYGANSYFDRGEVLVETTEITNTSWKEFSFDLKPKKDYAYFIIEACHKTPLLFPYNGNVLVDNLSVLTPRFCGKTLAASSKPKTKPKPSTGTTTSGGVASVPTSLPNAYDEPSTKTYDRKRLKVGQTIGMEKLYFDADSTNLKRECIPVLDELYQFMSSNSDLSIEIGGHTNDVPPEEFCDRLSSARAKAVANYLTQKGISEERVKFKGYGKRQPLFPNVNSDNRRRNQRVEIKILSIG